MIYLLYDIALILLTPLIIPYHLYRSIKRGRGVSGFSERLGFIPLRIRSEIEGRDTIWVHAVSVGETIASQPLLRALKERFPDKKILMSNVTETGRSVAEKIDAVDCSVYFPFDYSLAVRRALKAIKPSLVVIVETEIWPNFLRVSRSLGIPAVMVNGRISDRSFGRYQNLSVAFKKVLTNFSALCMQSVEDARRIRAIGAPPASVHVTGNLKYDIPVKEVTAESRQDLFGEYGIPSGALVLVAGSTHQGEEETVINAFARLVKEGRDLFLVLVPRHPERAASVGELLAAQGIVYTLRSQLQLKSESFRPGEVLLVDTIGELMKLYALADVVFVGGSLVPTGGHNLLEPASLAKPVVFGPHMTNFREISSLILRHGGGVQVDGGEGLLTALKSLLEDESERVAMGRRGAGILTENNGATRRHLEIIERVLGIP